MPLPNIIVPTYPDVPRAPGVPPLLREAGAVLTTGVRLLGDAIQILRLFSGPQWGVFSDDTGLELFEGANFIGVEWRKDSRIADYPMENGSFQSYNKVQTPWEAKVTLAVGDDPQVFGFSVPTLPTIPGLGGFGGVVGGALARRTAFINTIDFAADSLDLFTLVTPEKSYPSANIIHHDYRRIAEKGVTLLAVDIWLMQVRQDATADFADTKSASGASPVDGGQVQASPPSPSVSRSANPIGGQGLLG